MPWGCRAPLWGLSTPNSTQASWETLILKNWANFSRVMWICGRFAPCGPSALLATKKASFGKKKDMPFGNPPNHGTKNCGLFTKYQFLILPFMGQKVVFWVKKRCFGVFWTKCEVADLKQRKKTAMDHRKKIQSLLLPTYGPGDAPDCITECGPLPVNMAICAINQIFFQNKGFP